MFRAVVKRMLLSGTVASSCLITATTAQTLIAIPDHPNGIYAVGEPVGWTLQAPPQNAAGRLAYTILENNSRVIETGKLDLYSGEARIETRLREPAMLLVEIDPEAAAPPEKLAPNESAAGKKGAHALLLGAAVGPTLLRPSVSKPADFDAFWHAKLAELAKVPINPVLTPIIAEPASTNVDLYKVRLDSAGSHVQGYLAKPRKPGRFPALIIYQWAGVYKLNPQDAVKRAEDGWLAFNVDSHDLAPDSDAGVPADYFKLGDQHRETSYFLNMYLRDSRALDYISTLPEWDGKTIVLMGTSMGGQQSLITAGLNPDRITAVVVNEPAGADTNGNLHGREAGYPYWNSEDPAVMKTSLYFDPVNFAPKIKAATLMGVGFLDSSAPPVGLWIVFNELTGPKEIVPMIESAHNNITPDKQGNFLARQKQLLDRLLRGEPIKMQGIDTTSAGQQK